jgi:hypothetical protein
VKSPIPPFRVNLTRKPDNSDPLLRLTTPVAQARLRNYTYHLPITFAKYAHYPVPPCAGEGRMNSPDAGAHLLKVGLPKWRNLSAKNGAPGRPFLFGL